MKPMKKTGIFIIILILLAGVAPVGACPAVR